MTTRERLAGSPAEARTAELLRELAPRVLAILARRHRDFGAAEDAVQEALLAAFREWPSRGVPDHPRAWLLQVAARRMTDGIRADSARRRREEVSNAEVPDDERYASPPDEDDAPRGDDTLLLLFMCCHPALSRTSAIALTLRAVGGLTTAEIAAAFMVPEGTMAQRISRAKQTLKDRGATFQAPCEADREARLAAVLHVLYLVFNEGYATTAGDVVHRVDLSSEAIRLAREVRAVAPRSAEAAGLLALMLLTDARRAARVDADGGLVPLDEQDRSRWDRAAIAEGTAIVTESIARGAVGAYQLQAAIAALHGEAARAEDTDWAQIHALYGLLERMADNPMVTLNRVVAAAMVRGPRAGLDLLEPLERDPRIADHHRLHAVRAHLLERAGDFERAIESYGRAAERTSNAPERDYLRLKIARLSPPRHRS
ncbi:MAG: sigma-70 family RNA polymerase sigma factor [Polyangiaceae bacterium]